MGFCEAQIINNMSLYKGENYPRPYGHDDMYSWYAYTLRDAIPYAAWRLYEEPESTAVSYDLMPTISCYSWAAEPRLLVITPSNAQEYTDGHSGGLVVTPSRGPVRRKDYSWDRKFVKRLCRQYDVDGVQFSGFTDDTGHAWHNEVCIEDPSRFLARTKVVTLNPWEGMKKKTLETYQKIAEAARVLPECGDNWNRVAAVERTARSLNLDHIIDARLVSKYMCFHNDIHLMRSLFAPYNVSDLTVDFMLQFGVQQ